MKFITLLVVLMASTAFAADTITTIPVGQTGQTVQGGTVQTETAEAATAAPAKKKKHHHHHSKKPVPAPAPAASPAPAAK